MNDALFKAILAMDAYNRGYDAFINLPGVGSQIGNATIITDSLLTPSTSVGQAAGFYGVAYDYNAAAVISYRGTDNLIDTIDWTTGAGDPSTTQSGLAFQFYNDVATALNNGSPIDPRYVDISLTGHSLGGGLAGLVGALYNKSATIFDNMAFETAAHKTYVASDPILAFAAGADYSPEIRDIVYGTSPVWAETISSSPSSLIQTYYANGEILGLNRQLQETPQNLVPLYDLDGNGNPLLGPVQAHNMAALIIAMYADPAMANSIPASWQAAARYFWPVLFDNTFATQIVSTHGLSGTSVTNGDYAGILKTALAYSAIDEGTRVFGDTGIRALYNDANDLGAIIPLANLSSSIRDNLAEITKAYVQYAGHLALNKIEQSNFAEAVNGILNLSPDNRTLSLNFDAADWLKANGGIVDPAQFSKTELLDKLYADMGGSSSIRDLTDMLWQDRTQSIFDRTSFAVVGGQESTLETASADGKSTLFMGTESADMLVGSTGQDMIFGDAGDDRLIGGRGQDILIGGEGSDTADYSRDAANGGGQGISLLLDTNGNSNYAWDGFGNRDVLRSIENIKGTSSADAIRLTDIDSRLIDGNGGADVITYTGNVAQDIRGDAVSTRVYDANGVNYDRVITDGTITINGETILIDQGTASQVLDVTDAHDFSSSTVSGSFVLAAMTFGTGSVNIQNKSYVSAEIGGAQHSGYYSTSYSIASYIPGSWPRPSSTDVMQFVGIYNRNLEHGDIRVIGTNLGDIVRITAVADYWLNGSPSPDWVDKQNIDFVSGTGNDLVTLDPVAFGPETLTEIGYGYGTVNSLNISYTYTGGNDFIHNAQYLDQLVIWNGIEASRVSVNGSVVTIAGYGQIILEGRTEPLNIVFQNANGPILASWGNDAWTGGQGNETYYAKDGDDIIDAGTGMDTISGGMGADTFVISTGNGNDTILDYDFDEGDSLFFTPFVPGDFVTMRVNNDLIILSDTDNTTLSGFFDGFFGQKSLRIDMGYGPIDLVVNEAGKIVQGTNGTAVSEQILGTEGDDIISGLDGNDILYAVAGNDQLDGGNGDDLLVGGSGNDILIGNNGDDFVSGGGGDDYIVAASGLGNDYYNGGDGVDTIEYTSASHGTSITISGGEGRATGVDINNDTFWNIERIITGAGNDDVFIRDSTTPIDLTYISGEDVYLIARNTELSFGPGILPTDITINSVKPDYIDRMSMSLTIAGRGYLAITSEDNLIGKVITFADGSTLELLPNGLSNVAVGTDSADTFVLTDGVTIQDGREGIDIYNLSLRTAETMITIDQDKAIIAEAGELKRQAYNFENFITGIGNDTVTATNYAGAITYTNGTDIYNLDTISDNTTVRLDTGITSITSGTVTLSGEQVTEAVLSIGGRGTLTLRGDDLEGQQIMLSNGNYYTIYETGIAARGTILGTNHDDDILATPDVLQVNAYGGDDYITLTRLGGSGQIRADGGAGTDTINLSLLPGGLTVSMSFNPGGSTGTVTGPSGTATFSNIENVITGNGSDRITGNSTANVFDARGGTDTVIAGSGNDRIVGTADSVSDSYDGGTGTDTIDYSSVNSSVMVDLVTGLATGTTIGSDTLLNIENVVAGGGLDTLIAGAGIHTLQGGLNGDTYIIDLTAAGAGSKTIIDTHGLNILDLTIGNTALVYSYTASDLIISGAGLTASVILKDWFSGATPYQTISQLIVHDASGTRTISGPDIGIADENTAPVAVDDILDAVGSATVSGSVLANDRDPDGDTLTVQSQTVTTANGGLATLLADGTLAYTAADGFRGTDTLTYTVSDPDGAEDSATITINNIFTNRGPVASDDMFDAGNASVISGDILTAADSDPDGDTITVVPQTLLTDAGNLVVIQEDGTFKLVTRDGSAAIDQFTYTVRDAYGAMDTGTVTVSGISADHQALPDILSEDIRSFQALTQEVLAQEYAAGTQLFPTIKEGKGLSSRYVNGVSRENLTLDHDLEVRVNFVREDATNKNTLGFYTIDANGQIGNVQLLSTNLSAKGSGGYLNNGALLASLGTLEAGTEIGFFLISDGYNKNNGYNKFDLSRGHFEFIDTRGGDAANITDPAKRVSLVFVDQNGREKSVAGDVFHASIGSLNTDGKPHAISGLNASGNLQIAFEDIKGGGDGDFNDAVIELQIVPKVMVDLDPVHIAQGFALSRSDDQMISSAVVAFASGKQAGDTLLLADDVLAGTGVSSSVNADGQLTLSGQASASTYQNILQYLAFDTNAALPVAGERTFTVVVTGVDGSVDTSTLHTLIGSVGEVAPNGYVGVTTLDTLVATSEDSYMAQAYVDGLGADLRGFDLSSYQRADMTDGDSDDAVTLDIANILHMEMDDPLQVLGDVGDHLMLVGGTASRIGDQMVDGQAFSVYALTVGSVTGQLLVEDGVGITAAGV